MKTKLYRLVAVLLLGSLGVSCTTAYDAYGNPRPVVEPGTAALGLAAAGLAGYAIANSRNNNRHYHRGYGYNNYRYSGYNRYSSYRAPYRNSSYGYPVRSFQGHRVIRHPYRF